jgi:hypothetical protein
VSDWSTEKRTLRRVSSWCTGIPLDHQEDTISAEASFYQMPLHRRHVVGAWQANRMVAHLMRAVCVLKESPSLTASTPPHQHYKLEYPMAEFLGFSFGGRSIPRDINHLDLQDND